MKFRAISIPTPAKGQGNFPPKQVQPNQSMSLEEILERFTRGEPVAVGRDIQYHESDDDLEKVKNMDLVDREEYMDKLKQTRKDFDKQEKKKADAGRKAAREKIEEEERAKLAKEKGEKPDTAK